jgi:hypothetical protein
MTNLKMICLQYVYQKKRIEYCLMNYRSELYNKPPTRVLNNLIKHRQRNLKVPIFIKHKINIKSQYLNLIT